MPPFDTPVADGDDRDAGAERLDRAALLTAPAGPRPAAGGAGAAETPGILRLAWPAVVGNLLYSMVSLVDIKIVGSLGASAVASVTAGNRLFFVLQAVIMATGAGTTAMVARAWGAGDRGEAERVTKASLALGVAVALVLSLPGLLFPHALASIFRIDAEAITGAADFIFYLSIFNVAFAVSMILGNAVRAAGDTITPLCLGAATNVVNVFLVYGLVYGEFGFTALGVKGAAIATGGAFTFGALLTLLFWIRGWLRVGTRSRGSLTRARLRQIMHIGYPAALESGAVQAGFILFLFIVGFYGTDPFTAYGIGVQILSFSFVVGFGFSIAASTHVGQRLGANDRAGAMQSGWRAMAFSIGIMIVLGGAIIVFAEQIARFMIDDDEVVRLTVIFIYILGAMQPLMAIEFTLGGALRGAGDTRFPLVTTITGLLVVRGTTAGVFAWLGLSVEWIFAALIIDYIVKGVMLVARFKSGRWAEIEVGVGREAS